MTPVLKVIAPGFHSTVQDQGRRGFQHVGVPVCGALDGTGLALANALVGNAPEAACVEFIGSGAELEVVASSVRIALAGSGRLEIAGRDAPVHVGESARLSKGDVVRVRPGSEAFCSYLALEGGIDVPPCLGSRSTYTRAGFGGFAGRALRAGDELPGASDDVAAREEMGFGEPWDLGLDRAIRVVLGPQEDHFTAAAIEAFLAGVYAIAAASDRMGFRLAGPELAHEGDYNLVSDGIVPGSIQVPGSKLPIVAMADGGTTGGYPKIATVIAADLPRLGVRGAGRSVRFQAVTREEAEEIRREERRRLTEFVGAFRAVGVGGIRVEALYERNLIGGVVDAKE